MSAVIALEQSRSPRDVARVAEMLAAWLPDLQVRRAFADWMRQIVERLVPSGVELPPIRKLEDVSMTLVERAAEWAKEWLKEGLQQGIEQGIEQGLDRERALLCRMTASRFGLPTAERLAELLAPITDAERLADVGDWLVQVRHRRRLPRPRGRTAGRRELGQRLSQVGVVGLLPVRHDSAPDGPFRAAPVHVRRCHTQRAVRRPSTRSNSRWLLVTRVSASLRAWAAICRSLGPITSPHLPPYCTIPDIYSITGR